MDKNTIEPPYGTSLAEKLYELWQCFSHDVSDQLPEYYSSECESSQSVMSDDEREDDIDSQFQLKAWAIKSGRTRTSLNNLPNSLSKTHQYLTKDSRTLLHTPRKVNYGQKCSGLYIYFRIENGIKTCLNILTNHFFYQPSQLVCILILMV